MTIEGISVFFVVVVVQQTKPSFIIHGKKMEMKLFAIENKSFNMRLICKFFVF